MTGTVVRRALQVAGLAAGIVLFAGGVAHADGVSAMHEDGKKHHHSKSWKTDVDQDATNVCGNQLGHGGINFNATDCAAGNVIAQSGSGYADQNASYNYSGGSSWSWKTDVDQDATNVCGNDLGHGGINFNATDCVAGNAIVKGDKGGKDHKRGH